VDAVSGGADAEGAYLGGRRPQDRLPLLTDPLEGGEGLLLVILSLPTASPTSLAPAAAAPGSEVERTGNP
jgi:hypothetical protein